MSVDEEILNYLIAAKDYLSGEMIAQNLNLSQAAVCNAVEKLKKKELG